MILREDDSRYIDEFVYMGTKFSGNFIMQSERDGHRHLYLYDLNGRLQRQITEGDFDVLACTDTMPRAAPYITSNESGMYDCAVWKIDGRGRKTALTHRKVLPMPSSAPVTNIS